MKGVEACESRLPEISEDRRSGALIVDLSLFSSSVVLRAAYKLGARAHVFAEPADATAGRLTVTFRAKAGQDLETVIGDFSNELIDQRLREELAREMAPIRELVVAQAFAEGNLLDPLRDDGEWEEDPRGIGRAGGPGDR